MYVDSQSRREATSLIIPNISALYRRDSLLDVVTANPLTIEFFVLENGQPTVKSKKLRGLGVSHSLRGEMVGKKMIYLITDHEVFY